MARNSSKAGLQVYPPTSPSGGTATCFANLLDSNVISKWNWQTQSLDALLVAHQCTSNNGTKSTPALSADLWGDWREEVIWRTRDNQELRIYTSTIPTPHRMVTLMQDPQYRLAIAWQNVALQPATASEFLSRRRGAVAKGSR
jgi:rhamnogalacturonan endolyase